MRFLSQLIPALFLMAAVVAPASAEDDVTGAQAVIETQLSAFRAGDGALAYEQAAPAVRKAFPTADGFMEMVRKGYAPVMEARSFAFGRNVVRDATIFQEVLLTGPDGKDFSALYSLARQADGSLKITGVQLVKSATESI